MAIEHNVSLFDDRQQVEEVINELSSVGIEREGISLTMRDREGLQQMRNSNGTKVPHGIGAGAVTGAVIGGLAGLLGGAVLLATMGPGSLLAIGPVSASIGTGAAVAGAVVGSLMVAATTTGGLIGTLVGWGVPKEETQVYTEGIRRGGILVMANTVSKTQQGIVRAILRKHGAVNINNLALMYRKDG